MATIRFYALEALNNRPNIQPNYPADKISEYFGINVFDKPKMQKYLSADAFRAVMKAIEKGTKIELRIADQVAAGMKEWALEMGATHYTHWFQPLTGGTAEKHDAFFEQSETGVFENFDGKTLVQQEPDASSFPSGGIRNTFEARGYTAWDPSSPAFVLGKTLSIPTIFVSFTGEALDYKTPLIKALNALDRSAVKVCNLFDRRVTKVHANLGWEQEYFLIDEALYNARPDLVLSDRTLMGHASAKDQQFSDHYFSSIPLRVANFMRDFEIEALQLGIPVTTRHNEVAPNQYEVAPKFEEANLAVDHNLLLMDIMKHTAQKHKFRVLFHEKPFDGVNGSGKHNNWSLQTDTGINLFKPGRTPKTNLQFLTFIVNTLKAVHDNKDLLKASSLSHGNEYRLGANEAPPSIISVFLGAHVTKKLDAIEAQVTDQKMTPDEKTALKLNIGRIPEILVDNTDRNRTSPFAFTGNRFEFRAIGSSANCAAPMIVLNTAMADQLERFKIDVDDLVAKDVKRDEAIFQVLRRYIVETKPIRFEGNSYSEDWVQEAEKRKLTSKANAAKAYKAYIEEKSIALFERQGVLNRKELQARTEVLLENYINKVHIESRILCDLATNHIVPTAVKYQQQLLDNVRALKEVFGDEYKELAGNRIGLIREISQHITSIKDEAREMAELRSAFCQIVHAQEKAETYSEKLKPYLVSIRKSIDSLELIVDDEMWPLPKYREMLFAR